MPVAEVAATILPYFSSRTNMLKSSATHDIVSWCRTGAYSKSLTTPGDLKLFEDPDYRAVAEAIQALEHAGLLIQTTGGNSGGLGYFRRPPFRLIRSVRAG
jgi:hypothetical protein